MNPNQNDPNQPITPPQAGPLDTVPSAPYSSTPPTEPQPIQQPAAEPNVVAASNGFEPTTPQSIPQPVSNDPVTSPQPAAAPVPPNQPQPTQPLQTQPFTPPFGANPIATPRAKLPVKLIAIVGGSLVGLGLLGGIGWLVYTNFFNMIPLKTYDGDGYSVLVPEEYKKGEEFGGSITFTEKDDSEDTRSSESLSSIDVSLLGDSREDAIKQIDKNFDEDAIKESELDSEDETIKDYKLANTTVGGQEARKVSASIFKNDKRVGTIHILIVLGKDKFYYVVVAAHVDDSSFNNAANKILSSFKIN